MTSHLLKRHVRHADLRAGLDDAVGARAPIEAVADPDPFESDRVNGGQIRRRVWWTYALLAAVLVAYLFSLIRRPAGDTWTWLDGWTIVGLEVVASGLCIAKGVYFKQGRAIAFVLGGALLSWTLGDVVLTTLTLGGATAPTPSLADLFYLGFYPLAYVAVVLLLRTTVGTLSRPNWLDGLIAGMGAAAVCAAFAFHSIVVDAGSSSSQPPSTSPTRSVTSSCCSSSSAARRSWAATRRAPGSCSLAASRSTSWATRSTCSRTPPARRRSAATSTRSRGPPRSSSCRWPSGSDPGRPTRSDSREPAGLLPAGHRRGRRARPPRRRDAAKGERDRAHPRDPHAGGRRDPPRPVGERPAHPDRAAPPTGASPTSSPGLATGGTCSRCSTRSSRTCTTPQRAPTRWPSSSSTSTTSRRSTTPSGIPPATSCSARSARASRTRRAARTWCSASVATSSASCSSAPMPKRRRTSPSASPPSSTRPSTSTR